MKDVCAAFVRYNYSKKSFIRKIDKIKNQVNKIFIIDNSKKKINLSGKKIRYIYLGENYGIAHAQNFAIYQAIKEKFKYILLSDQDTLYPKFYVKKMILFFKKKDVGAVCPNLYDINKKKTLGFTLRYLCFKKTLNHDYNKNQKLVNLKSVYISESMASGTIIKLSFIKEIGYMNDDLFLDWVDFEWCWKLRDKNIKIVGVKNIFAKHKLGSNKIKIFNKIYHRHSLLRYYYIIRNGFILSIYGGKINLFWRINIFFNTLKYFIGALIINNFSKKSIKFFLKAFFKGLINHKGKLMKF